jgi:hypothetical protein
VYPDYGPSYKLEETVFLMDRCHAARHVTPPDEQVEMKELASDTAEITTQI